MCLQAFQNLSHSEFRSSFPDTTNSATNSQSVDDSAESNSLTAEADRGE